MSKMWTTPLLAPAGFTIPKAMIFRWYFAPQMLWEVQQHQGAPNHDVLPISDVLHLQALLLL